MAIESRNPATGELIERYEALGPDAIEAALARSWSAFERYRGIPFEERSGWLSRAAEILEGEKLELAKLMTWEMGKPLGAAVAEVEKCAWVCRYYAEEGPRMLADETVATSARRSFVRYEPIGPILAIMPWNFPFWQVFRFAAPALLAGNTGLLKHAPSVPGCALRIANILSRAGFPEGVFQSLLMEVEHVPRVLDDPRVRAATLTGSVRAGSAVAERAGKRIKKVVLELGGSDPFIVMPSADIDATASAAVTARTINNGQSCIAAKRFIVHDEVYDSFVERFVGGLEKLRVGDPMDERTQIGPLSSPAILEEVERQVRETIARGGRLLTGGDRLPRPGNFYLPTALAEVPIDSPAYAEEIFGPVASVFRVADRNEALRLANDTAFGLGSSVWTRDEEDVAFFVDRLESGQVFVNAMVASDPRLPFGGVKQSGFGRELGVWGIREFVNVKTIWVGGTPLARAE